MDTERKYIYRCDTCGREWRTRLIVVEFHGKKGRLYGSHQAPPEFPEAFCSGDTATLILPDTQTKLFEGVNK